eukprot:14951914-Alexandrium_andersonii.AAC.1
MTPTRRRRRRVFRNSKRDPSKTPPPLDPAAARGRASSNASRSGGQCVAHPCICMSVEPGAPASGGGSPNTAR